MTDSNPRVTESFPDLWGSGLDPRVQPVPFDGSAEEADPGFLPPPQYQKSQHQYPEAPLLLQEGEDVVVTEKLVGALARYAHHDGRFWVASASCFRDPAGTSQWAVVARRSNLPALLEHFPGYALYGVLYGGVDGFPYDTQEGHLGFRVEDVYDVYGERFLDFEELRVFIYQHVHARAKELGVPGVQCVPTLYRGPWSFGDTYSRFCSEKPTSGPYSQLAATATPPRRHLCAGVVVRPTRERLVPFEPGSKRYVRVLVEVPTEAWTSLRRGGR